MKPQIPPIRPRILPITQPPPTANAIKENNTAKVAPVEEPLLLVIHPPTSVKRPHITASPAPADPVT